MVISNSATTAMMIPIALGIAERVVQDAPQTGTTEDLNDASETSMAVDGDGRHDGFADAFEQPNFRIVMLLSVAYAASISGVGTPPNAILVSQLVEQIDYTITFVDWLFIGLPFVIVGLPLTWYVLVVIVYPPAVDDARAARIEANRYLREAGPPSTAERRVLMVTGATAGLWLLGGVGFLFDGILPTT